MSSPPPLAAVNRPLKAVAALLRQAAPVAELGEVDAAIDAARLALAALEALARRPTGDR